MIRTITNFASKLCPGAPLALVFGVSLVSATRAHALKESLEITPANLQASGFSLTVASRDAGMVEFTLSRDLTKARQFAPDSELVVRRSATLKVSGKSGLLVECNLEPAERKNTVTYRFRIERNHVPASHFTLAEIDDYKDLARARLIGGGTFYEFRLGLFANQASPEDR